jgi:hypothetical protein
MKRFVYRFMGLPVLLAFAACGGSDNNNGGDGGAGSSGGVLAQACGLGCPGDTVEGVKLSGVLEGNASISGVQKVDSFFAAVVNFKSSADGVSAGIQAELDAIRADFGLKADADLAAGLKAQFEANLTAKLDIDYEPARCAVDAQATLEASAKCDATVSGGKAQVECKGSCEAEVTADVKCDASADLRCTLTAPDIECTGECRGSCSAKLDVAAKCEGTCNGECMGTCSAFSDSAGTKCAGACDGMCKGSCDVQLAAEAKCMGTCRGECTYTKPSGGCEGGIRAECRAKANASFMCTGKCTGEFEPPMVSAECKASAKAQASVNVECTPPRLAVNYALKASADAKFKAALSTLVDVRLPKLLQAVGKAKLVAKAGEDLGVAATGAVKGAADALKAQGGLDLKLIVGVDCAIRELPKAKTAVQSSADNLTMKLTASKNITDMLGLGA